MTDATAASQGRKLRTIIGASMIGTTIEWYDFFLYGTAAALVFNKLFFPKSDPWTGTMLAFATYALGFAARPLGGLVFGHFGDRIGRKRLLLLSLILMGGSTMLIGVLPTYGAIGVAAPLLLVVLRMVQGFAVGGEWGGAVLLVAEHGSAARRGFWTSWPQMGVASGNLLASAVLAIMTAFQSEAEFLAWGWRVPFLLSAILIGIGWWVRSTVEESPLFTGLRKVADLVRAPALEVLKHRPGQLLLGGGARLVENIVFYVITVFAVTYMTQNVHLTRQLALNAVMIGAAVEIVAIPFFGALSDKIGRKPVYAAGALFTTIWMFVFFPLLDTASPGLVILAVVLGLLPHAAMYGVQAAFLAEMFPTRMRYSGVSLASQVTSILAGSLAPIIAIAILAKTHRSLGISIYVGVAGLISFACAIAAKETRGKTFEEIDLEP